MSKIIDILTATEPMTVGRLKDWIAESGVPDDAVLWVQQETISPLSRALSIIDIDGANNLALCGALMARNAPAHSTFRSCSEWL